MHFTFKIIDSPYSAIIRRAKYRALAAIVFVFVFSQISSRTITEDLLWLLILTVPFSYAIERIIRPYSEKNRKTKSIGELVLRESSLVLYDNSFWKQTIDLTQASEVCFVYQGFDGEINEAGNKQSGLGNFIEFNYQRKTYQYSIFLESIAAKNAFFLVERWFQKRGLLSQSSQNL